jgi:hypothetical protein
VIYFILNARAEAIKIGTAVDVSGRLKTLQTGSAEPLELLCSVPGDKDAELRLHRRFAADRLRGEWFRVTPELMGLINALRAADLAPGPGPTEWDRFRAKAGAVEARVRREVGFPVQVFYGVEPHLTGARGRNFSYQIMPAPGYDVGDRVSAQFWWWHVDEACQWFADYEEAGESFIQSFYRWRDAKGARHAQTKGGNSLRIG